MNSQLHVSILSAMVAGAMQFGMLALAMTAFGAYWLGSPLGFKLALLAAGLSYLTQTASSVNETFFLPGQHVVFGGVILAMWAVTVVVGALAIAVVLMA